MMTDALIATFVTGLREQLAMVHPPIEVIRPRMQRHIRIDWVANRVHSHYIILSFDTEAITALPPFAYTRRWPYAEVTVTAVAEWIAGEVRASERQWLPPGTD
jgi:hypothetical protein